MELGVPDHRQRASREQTAQIPVALFSDPAEPEFCFGTRPTQAEKFLHCLPPTWTIRCRIGSRRFPPIIPQPMQFVWSKASMQW
jgi:hypothetical protein